MSAVVLLVSAGVGPVEVRRFVALLADHLATVCLDRGAMVTSVLVQGDEEAPSSVAIHLAVAPPAVSALAGTHALVARSPDRGKRARKRWYAGVTVTPAEEAGDAPSVDPRDVTITAMRAGGPGGQHVNKTSSAVRAEHRPSGIVVRVADERSQRDNIRLALARLSLALRDRAKREAAEGERARRLSHYRVERGRPAFVYEVGSKGGLSLCVGTCSK